MKPASATTLFTFAVLSLGFMTALVDASQLIQPQRRRAAHRVSIFSSLLKRGSEAPRSRLEIRRVKRLEESEPSAKRSFGPSYSHILERSVTQEDEEGPALNQDEEEDDTDDKSEDDDDDPKDNCNGDNETLDEDYQESGYDHFSTIGIEIQALFDKISSSKDTGLGGAIALPKLAINPTFTVTPTATQNTDLQSSSSGVTTPPLQNKTSKTQALQGGQDKQANSKPMTDEGTPKKNGTHSGASDGNQKPSTATESHGGMLSQKDYKCPCNDPHASSDHPNGSIDFLNCGINSGGWKPPHVEVNELVMASPDQAIQNPTFSPCVKYLDLFKQVAAKYDLPPILIMSFAMQESTCNEHLRGPNGEIGIMQLTPDKCTNAQCWDPRTNIEKGASLFKGLLDTSNGNAIQAIGSYNGWEPGMTMSQATSKQYGCAAQRNLDYLYQTLSGFCQGKDGYSGAFNVYDNLKKC